MSEIATYWDGIAALTVSEAVTNAINLAWGVHPDQRRTSHTKCLIVVDNLYSSSPFARCLVEEGVGAIIVTTTLEEVTREMKADEQHVIRLEPTLDDHAIWSIFWDSIERKEFLTPHHRQTLLSIKDEIIHKCSGLPLAAKTLAEVISTQMAQEEYWSNSEVRKEVCLRVDPLDNDSVLEAQKKVESLPGIDRVTVDISRYTSRYHMKIQGVRDVVEVNRELERFFPVELISVGPKN